MNFDPKVTVPYRTIGAGLSLADGDAGGREKQKLQGREGGDTLASLTTKDSNPSKLHTGSYGSIRNGHF